MYCGSCGEKIPSDSVFCAHCGESCEKSDSVSKKKKISPSSPKKSNIQTKSVKKKPKKKSKDYLDIEIPGFLKNRNIRFTTDKILLEDKSMKYEDISAVSCKQVFHSTNLIPTSQEFSFSFYTLYDSIVLNFGTSLHIGTKARKDIFSKLYFLTKNLIAPILVKKMILDIIEDDNTVQVGSIYFDKSGYYKKRFLRGEDWVHWTDIVPTPIIKSGEIVLYKREGNKYSMFNSIPVSALNAIVIPELVEVMNKIVNSSQ